MTAQQEALKACPICDAEALYERFESFGSEPDVYSVGCSDDKCIQTPARFRNKHEAAAYWNTRASLSVNDDAAFNRGYAACLANAVRLESYSPGDIGGGISLQDYESSGVEEYDLSVLRKAMKDE